MKAQIALAIQTCLFWTRKYCAERLFYWREKSSHCSFYLQYIHLFI